MKSSHSEISTSTNKIGLGGSCHWCTEAIFQSLRGVDQVLQGWIGAEEDATLSEAVIVHFDALKIDLAVLIEIHLRTHSSTSQHAFREKYRSAIYTFSKEQFSDCQQILESLQTQFEKPLITQVLHFDTFKLNKENYLNYYRNNPEKPFCRNVIDPKLDLLRSEFGNSMTS